MHAQKSGARVYVDKNVWHEQQADGSQKWYALEPGTGAVIEIDPDQAYFYTEAWQAKEREADEDIAAGRFKTFDTMEAFLADLNSDDE